MEQSADRLAALFEPVITSMGYELVGVLYRPSRGEGLVRVYIDSQAGIGVDDCARVSYQVSGILDVEDPVPGHYRLEVSSPGINRPLFTLAQWQRYVGESVRVRLLGTWEGRRSLSGTLIGVEADTVIIDDQAGRYQVPFDRVDRANLVVMPE
jgi:ribosome maturation factor RimP